MAINWNDRPEWMKEEENNKSIPEPDNTLTAKAPEFDIQENWFIKNFSVPIIITKVIDKVDRYIKRGRPKGSRTKYIFVSKEDFVKTIREQKIALENAGEYPSQEKVAELLEFEGPRAIRRLCDDYGVDYKDI